MDCIDDVVLVGGEVGDGLVDHAGLNVGEKVCDLGEMACPVEALAGVNGLAGSRNESLSLLSLVGLFCLILHSFEEPNLVSSLVDVVLEDSFAFFGLSSGDVERPVSCVGLDDVSLVGEGSLVGPGNVEPAAVVFAGIGDDGSGVVLFIAEHTKSVFIVGDDRVPVLFNVDVEGLVCIACEPLHDCLVGLRINGQGDVSVEDRHDFVGSVGVWLEVAGDVGDNDFLEVPNLVATLVNVVLQHILAFLCLAASDIECLVVGVGLDEVSLQGEGSLVSAHNIEPAAVALVAIRHDLSAVVLLVFGHAN